MVNAEDFYLDLLERRKEVARFPVGDASRQLLVIGDFVTCLEIDGLSSWLAGISKSDSDPANWTELVETVQALSKIGATRTSNALLSLIPRIHEHKGYESWEQLLSDQGVDLYEDDLDDVERIWELAETLLRGLPADTAD